MTLAYRPDETSPFVRAFLADRAIEPGAMDLAIDARDEMLGFLVQNLEGDRERALFGYFRSGLSVADTMLQVLRWRFGGLSGIRVLDFASGYGRVTRFLLRDLSPEQVRVSDVYADGVRFQQERFGVHGIVSTVLPGDFRCEETFDAILVTSLFTHLPDERFVEWLRVLFGLLRPGGVLLFSTHDAALLEPGLEMPPGGLLFQEISESGSLDTRDYGSTWVTEAFVHGAVERALGGPSASVHRLDRGLCNYQDLYVAVLEPGVDFSSLNVVREPHVFVEHAGLHGTDRLEMSGWAVILEGDLEAVELVLDGQVLGSFPIGHPRPEVAAMLGEERFVRSGWSGSATLPAGFPRATTVFLLRVRDTSGRSHLVRASTLESLLLESTRNDVRFLSGELRKADEHLKAMKASSEAEIGGLTARIAAMEQSRFWKMRKAWFRLKRTLGLTDEE